VTPTPPSRARPGPRRALSEAEILTAALRLLDRGGPAALSVRGVANEVGVSPNALYTYFPTKSALARALVEGLLGHVDRSTLADRSQPWRTRIVDFALTVRTLLLSHPGAVPLLLGSPYDGPNALASHEALLEVLADAGLSPREAARAAYLIITYILGSIALDVAEHDPAAVPLDEPARTAVRRAALTRMPSANYPRTAASAEVIAAYNTTAQYTWGLHRLLDGLTVSAVSTS
jgi:AcrR family transcriptional regulator